MFCVSPSERASNLLAARQLAKPVFDAHESRLCFKRKPSLFQTKAVFVKHVNGTSPSVTVQM